MLLYGYVVLFAAAFPLAPLIAFMMNVIEVHVDAYKLTVYGRPKPQYAADIGMWAYFLGVMSTASVISNMGLIIYSSPFFDEYREDQKLLGFVIVENAMLVLKRTVEVREPTLQRTRHGTLYATPRVDTSPRFLFRCARFSARRSGCATESEGD